MNETTFRVMLTSKGFPEPSVIEREANLVTTDHVHDYTACALILDGEISVVTAERTTVWARRYLYPRKRYHPPRGIRSAGRAPVVQQPRALR